MGSRKMSMGVVILISWASWVVVYSSSPECSTITGLFSACYTFTTYGSPDPLPGSPCCDAMSSLGIMADTIGNRRLVCRCLMGLITTYNPNATAIATLPGFCGLSLGFTINPNTDCNSLFTR